MATVNFMQPDVQAEQDQIQRNRLIAEQLRQQSQQPLQGVQSGRVYVGPSWTQGLAKLLQGYQSGQMNQQADADTKRLAALLQNKNQADAAGFTEALSGKPAGRMADMGEIDPSLAGMGPVEQTSPAIPPDRNRALQIALGSQNPMIQGAGGALIKDMIPKQAEGVNINGQLVNKYTGEPMGKAIPKQEGGFVLNPGGKRYGPDGKLIAESAPNLTNVNGQMVNPQTAVPVGAPIPKQANPFENLVLPGPNGTVVPNDPLINAKAKVAQAGASNVNVNTVQKPFLNEIGKGVGEAVNNAYTGAQSAQQSLANVAQIEAGLKNALVGPGAGVRLKLSQIGEVMGVNGADATERLQNTRAIMQGLARQELAAAGQMKGQGQITEAERGILRRAESGDIAEMTVPELKTMLGAIRKTASYRIQQHQQNMDRLSRDPNAAGIVDYMRVNSPQGATSVLDQADAIINGSK